MVQAGELRHRITIEQTTQSRSATGDVTDTWSTFATRWAKLEAATGQERFEAEREHAEVSHVFTLRHLDGVTAKMRVKYGSRLFDIEAPFDPDGRKEKLVILANEDV